DPNPVAAMPSMHQAVTVAACLFALHSRRRWLRWGALLYCLAMAYTLVYTGEHYVLDALVGSGIAIYAYVFAGRWMGAMGPLYHSAFRRSRRAASGTAYDPVTPEPATVLTRTE